MQLDDGPLEEQEIAFILQQVLRALVYVHAQHRVHRDIKAANVLLSVAGAVKVSDFGVSGQMTGKIQLSVRQRCEYPNAIGSYEGRGAQHMLCFSHHPCCMPSASSLDKVCWYSVIALHWMPAEVIVASLKVLTASYDFLGHQAKLCGVCRNAGRAS